MAESEHNVTININGNANVAVNALNKVRTGLNGVLKYAQMAFGFVSKINWVVGGIQTIVRGITRLKDKIEEVRTRAARLAFAFEMRRAANDTERLVGWHEKLAKLLKDELDTLSKRRAVEALYEQGAKDREDGRREADRTRRIYEAKTPEEEQALRDRFEREDAQIAEDRKKKGIKKQIAALDEDESAYSSKARSLRENSAAIEKQLEYERLNLRRARAGREDGEEPGEQERAVAARVKALEERKKANAEEIETYEKEAKFRRDQIAALYETLDAAGGTRSVASAALRQRQRDKEKARENDRATTEADREWKERRERDAHKKEVEADVENQYSVGNKKKILDVQAANARTEAARLVKEYEAEMAKAAGSRDAKKLADLRGKIDALETDAESYEKRSKDIEADDISRRIGDADGLADRVTSADAVSQNRLTAMGLGSGVSASGTVQSDVRKLVDLLKQEVDATKNIKLGELPGATYGE